MKFLLVLIVVVVGLWLLLGRSLGTWRQSRPRPGKEPAAQASLQQMVRCAHCGVHLPRADARRHGEHFYCCADHQAEGPRGP